MKPTKPRKPKPAGPPAVADTTALAGAPPPLEARIYTLRGVRVMLDIDLAEIYGVPTFRLNEAVKRNRKRFPKDFIFQLGAEDVARLTSQFAMSKPLGRGGRRTRPYAFTEHGALMLASVLNSARAVEMSVYVVRAFVQLRSLVLENRELAAGLRELERRVAGHGEDLQTLVAAVRELMEPPPAAAPPAERPRIGFQKQSLPV